MSPFSKALLSLAFSLAWASAMPSSTWGGRMQASPCDAWVAALASMSLLQTVIGQATIFVQRQCGCAGCWGNLSMGKVLPSRPPQTGHMRSSSMASHSSFWMPTRSWNLSLPMLWARRTSVRAIISMRYCALLNTRLPAWRKESLSMITLPMSRTMSSAPLPVATPFRMVRLMPSASSRWTSPASVRLYCAMKSRALVSTMVNTLVASLSMPSGFRSA